MAQGIIKKLEKAQLCGRGGAGFLTSKKWQIFKEAQSDKKYIICNAAEGDPQLSKDGYILNSYLKDVVLGIKIALREFPGSIAYIYLRKDYFEKFHKELDSLIGKKPIRLFKKTGQYLAGEETALLESIEKRKAEPRKKPPYPCSQGLFNQPTLINNVETFYFISQIAKDRYKNEQFYCLSGNIKNKGVFKLKEGLTIKQVLEKTKNLPQKDFFVQAGGTLGEFLLPDELDQKIRGLASIVVYSKKKNNPLSLAKKIIQFAMYQNCDKCTPCREGVYRLFEEFNKKEQEKEILDDIFFVLEQTTLCPLGAMAGKAISSLYQKIIQNND